MPIVRAWRPFPRFMLISLWFLTRFECYFEFETHHFLKEVRCARYFRLVNLKICFEINAQQLFGPMRCVLGVLWLGLRRANVIKRFIRDS